MTLLGEPFTNMCQNLAKNTENTGKMICDGVGPKVSGQTYKSRAKWKRLQGIYSAIYVEVNVSVCAEIRGDYTEK